MSTRSRTPLSPSLGRALALGFSLALRTPGVLLLNFATDALATLLRLAAWLTLGGVALRMLWVGRATGLPPLAGGVAAAALLAVLLRFVGRAGAIRAFQARLTTSTLGTPGEEGGAILARMLSGACRALGVAALALPLLLGAFLYELTLLIAVAFWLWGGVQGALSFEWALAGLAFAMVLLGALGWLVRSWLWMGVIRAVDGEVRAPRALAAGTGVFLRRLGAIAALSLLFGVLAGVIGSSAGTFRYLFTALFESESRGVSVVGIGVLLILVGALDALVGAFLEIAELGALVALDAGDRGTLPETVRTRGTGTVEPVASVVIESTTESSVTLGSSLLLPP